MPEGQDAANDIHLGFCAICTVFRDSTCNATGRGVNQGVKCRLNAIIRICRLNAMSMIYVRMQMPVECGEGCTLNAKSDYMQ